MSFHDFFHDPKFSCHVRTFSKLSLLILLKSLSPSCFLSPLTNEWKLYMFVFQVFFNQNRVILTVTWIALTYLLVLSRLQTLIHLFHILHNSEKLEHKQNLVHNNITITGEGKSKGSDNLLSKEIEDITWSCRVTKFLFERWKIFFNTKTEINFVSPSGHIIFYLHV